MRIQSLLFGTLLLSLVGCGSKASSSAATGTPLSEADYKTQIRQIGMDITKAGTGLVPTETKINAEHRKLATAAELKVFDDTIASMTDLNHKIAAMVPPAAFAHRHELAIKFSALAVKELTDERDNFKRGDGSMDDVVKKDIADEREAISTMQAEDQKTGFTTNS